MAVYEIRRDGDAPIRFSGSEVASDRIGEDDRPRSRSRSWSLAVYATDAGRYVTSVVYDTTWPSETPLYDAAAHETLDDAVEWVREYDPIARWEAAGCGFPRHGKYAERHRALRNRLRSRWLSMVGHLLSKVSFEEA